MHAEGFGGVPVFCGIVADVEGAGSFDSEGSECVLENVGVGFVGADFAGDEDFFEQICNAEMVEDGAETAVEIGNNGETLGLVKGGEGPKGVGIGLPDPRLGEMLVEVFEIGVEIQCCLNFRGDFLHFYYFRD